MVAVTIIERKEPIELDPLVEFFRRYGFLPLPDRPATEREREREPEPALAPSSDAFPGSSPAAFFRLASDSSAASKIESKTSGLSFESVR